jgi:hypothetical protein
MPTPIPRASALQKWFQKIAGAATLWRRLKKIKHYIN